MHFLSNTNENKQRLYKIQKCLTSLFYHVLLIKQNECIYKDSNTKIPELFPNH